MILTRAYTRLIVAAPLTLDGSVIAATLMGAHRLLPDKPLLFVMTSLFALLQGLLAVDMLVYLYLGVGRLLDGQREAADLDNEPAPEPVEDGAERLAAWLATKNSVEAQIGLFERTHDYDVERMRLHLAGTPVEIGDGFMVEKYRLALEQLAPPANDEAPPGASPSSSR